jgi:hypothetical protein
MWGRKETLFRRPHNATHLDTFSHLGNFLVSMWGNAALAQSIGSSKINKSSAKRGSALTISGLGIGVKLLNEPSFSCHPVTDDKIPAIVFVEVYIASFPN